MRIGDLARSTGTPVQTIRYYEQQGLLAPPRREDNNYRVYTEAHAERLAFIRQCRGLDMALDEIRALLALREAPGPDCGEVNALLDEHIGHVTARIREMRALERSLRALRARCPEPHAVAQCGILQHLDSAAAAPAAAAPAAPAPARAHVRGPHRR